MPPDYEIRVESTDPAFIAWLIARNDEDAPPFEIVVDESVEDDVEWVEVQPRADQGEQSWQAYLEEEEAEIERAQQRETPLPAVMQNHHREVIKRNSLETLAQFVAEVEDVCVSTLEESVFEALDRALNRIGV